MAPCVARDRWHRAWPAIDGTVRGPREILTVVGWFLGSFLTIYMKQIEINGAGGSVTVVANPWVRRFPVSVRGPRSTAPCVARDRWHHAWPTIDDDDGDDYYYFYYYYYYY